MSVPLRHLPNAMLDVLGYHLGFARRLAPCLLADVHHRETPTHLREFGALPRPASVAVAGCRREVVADPFVRAVISPRLHRVITRVFTRVESEVPAARRTSDVLRGGLDFRRCIRERIRQVAETGTVSSADSQHDRAGKQKRENVAWLEQQWPPDALVDDACTSGRP